VQAACPKGPVWLLFRHGADIHAGSDIGKLYRYFASDNGLIAEFLRDWPDVGQDRYILAFHRGYFPIISTKAIINLDYNTRTTFRRHNIFMASFLLD
jgi:hypothetical protein